MDTGVCAGVQRVLEDHNNIAVRVTVGGGYMLFTLFLCGNGGRKALLDMIPGTSFLTCPKFAMGYQTSSFTSPVSLLIYTKSKTRS